MSPLYRVFILLVAVAAASCTTTFTSEHACSDAEDCRRAGIDTRDAHCEARMGSRKGVRVDIENEYLPELLFCENGAAEGEALKALAVAARSYLYYMLDTKGYIRNSIKDQVSDCKGSDKAGRDKSNKYNKAVQATSGEVLRYDGVQVCAFYHAGAVWPDAAGEPEDDKYDVSSCDSTQRDELASCCKGPDVGGTENNITYNYNAAGSEIEKAPVGGDVTENRGLLSQNGAECLAAEGFDYKEILRFYYGRDIGITRAVGECIDAEPGTDNGDGGDDTDDGGSGDMLPPSNDPWIGDGCDGTATSCDFTAGGKTGECVEFAGTGTTGPTSLYGVCSIACAGYCPDRDGETQTFCAQMADGTGQCEVLPTEAGGCSAVPGTEQRAMWRFVGASGAPSVLRAACVPPAEGISCMSGAGVCVDRDYPGACENGTLTPGFCPGGSDIQCCSPP